MRSHRGLYKPRPHHVCCSFYLRTKKATYQTTQARTSCTGTQARTIHTSTVSNQTKLSTPLPNQTKHAQRTHLPLRLARHLNLIHHTTPDHERHHVRGTRVAARRTRAQELGQETLAQMVSQAPPRRLGALQPSLTGYSTRQAATSSPWW